MTSLPPNYRWWQEESGSWLREIEQRKAEMPIYHLQEMFLADYLSRCGNVRVLEFGSGFGRHLCYLDQLPNVEVFGYEQSELMVKQMHGVRAGWRREHIRIGHPLEALPYADGEFDVVFTVSVLIHVQPEDLERILRELCRVASEQILHIENRAALTEGLTSRAHDGCWAHDLVGAYAALGKKAEILPSCFGLEDLYRVGLGDRPLPDPIDPVVADRWRTLDLTLSETLAALHAELQEEVQRGEALRDSLRSILGWE